MLICERCGRNIEQGDVQIETSGEFTCPYCEHVQYTEEEEG
jgi:DNA-directed RNA polymerase subunit RPC12/RpoP